MRIGFDLTSGATLQELPLPENTSLLITPKLMLQPNQGDIKAEFTDGNISRCELNLLVGSDDLKQMSSAGLSGINASSDLEQNLLVEVKFLLNLERLGGLVSKFETVQEPLDLLFVRDESYPVLLNLEHFDAVAISQDVEKVEGEVELETEG